MVGEARIGGQIRPADRFAQTGQYLPACRQVNAITRPSLVS